MTRHTGDSRAAVPEAGRAQLALPSPLTHFSPTARIAGALIVVLFVLLRIWKLTSYGLFSDEVFTAQTIHRPWPQMLNAVIADVVHPPLFYFLSKAWILPGDALLWMKLFPVVFAILAILPFSLLCRELRLSGATFNLALFMMAVNEYLINYSQEFRMYSLLMALVTASMWLFARTVNVRAAAVTLHLSLFTVNALLVYTHYYGWLVIAGELAYLLLRRRDRAWSFAISVGALAACFIPWTVLVTEAGYEKGGLGPNLRWNTSPSVRDFFQHYITLSGPIYNSWRPYATVFSSILFFTPIAWWTWHTVVRPKARRLGAPIDERVPATDENLSSSGRAGSAEGTQAAESPDALLWLAIMAFLPAIIAFAASYALPQSVWGARFLIIVAPAYLLLVATSVTRLRSPRLRVIVVALVAAWAGFSAVLQLTHRDKIDWRSPIAQMISQEPRAAGPVRVYTRQGVTGTTITYYLEQGNEARFQVEYVDDFADIEDGHFWIAFVRYRHETGPQPYQVFTDRGDRLGPVIEADAAGHSVLMVPVNHGQEAR